MTCSGSGADIVASDCASPAPEHGFVEIRIDAEPTEVEVALGYEGKTRVTYTSKPVYSEFRPNGPGCEPVCKSGAITMKVPELVPIK